MNTSATEAETLRFLEGLWFRHGQAIVRRIMDVYKLSEDQREALEEILLRPNDWAVVIAPPLTKNIS
jgi:hypothetical protein